MTTSADKKGRGRRNRGNEGRSEKSGGRKGQGTGRQRPSGKGRARKGRAGTDTGAGSAARSGIARLLSGPGKWLAGAVAAGLAAIIGTVVTALWSDALDARRDLAGEPPIRVVVETGIGDGVDGATAEPIIDGPDRFLLLRGFSWEQWDDLVRRRGMAPIEFQNLTILLQGKRDETIRIIDVRPHILSVGPVFDGTCVTLPTQGQADVFPVHADLDHLSPGTPGEPRSTYLEKSIDLKKEERATVEFGVVARKHSYTWEVEIVYDYGDEPHFQHMYVKNTGGVPFRVTGPAKTYGVVYGDPSISNIYREVGRNIGCGPRTSR